MEPFKGDVITPERNNHKIVKITQSELRGGISYYVPTYIDYLLEEQVITKTQRGWGIAYWNLRESAMAFMGVSKNKLYQDYVGEDNSLEFDRTDEIERDAMGVYTLLIRKLHKPYQGILDTCCVSTEGQTEIQRSYIMRAFNESAIVSAFVSVQKLIPEANEEYEKKLLDENNA